MDYWKECIANAAEECRLSLTVEQLQYLTDEVENAHENYGMAFYSPPASDRIAEIKREYDDKLKKLQLKLEQYQTNAETAIRQALCQPKDCNLSIGEHGEVTRYDGRFTVIQ